MHIRLKQHVGVEDEATHNPIFIDKSFDGCLPTCEATGQAPPTSSAAFAQMAANRFLNIYQTAIEKERARIADEMSRGYFADMAGLKRHGGKIAIANKVIIPAMVAVKFPDLEVIDKDI